MFRQLCWIISVAALCISKMTEPFMPPFIAMELSHVVRHSALTLDSKRQLLLECLDDYPTLIIADDVDAVLDDRRVGSLFTFDIPNTASKVLLTSRRDIPRITSVNTSAFSVPEGEIFIGSRIVTYQLDQKFVHARSHSHYPRGPLIKSVVALRPVAIQDEFLNIDNEHVSRHCSRYVKRAGLRVAAERPLTHSYPSRRRPS